MFQKEHRLEPACEQLRKTLRIFGCSHGIALKRGEQRLSQPRTGIRGVEDGGDVVGDGSHGASPVRNTVPWYANEQRKVCEVFTLPLRQPGC